ATSRLLATDPLGPQSTEVTLAKSSSPHPITAARELRLGRDPYAFLTNEWGIKTPFRLSTVRASPALLTKKGNSKTNSLEADSMTQRFIAVLVLLVAVAAMGLAGLAQDAPSEAPAGFDTPTLSQNPGSQSPSKGLAQ